MPWNGHTDPRSTTNHWLMAQLHGGSVYYDRAGERCTSICWWSPRLPQRTRGSPFAALRSAVGGADSGGRLTKVDNSLALGLGAPRFFAAWRASSPAGLAILPPRGWNLVGQRLQGRSFKPLDLTNRIADAATKARANSVSSRQCRCSGRVTSSLVIVKLHNYA
jgi:hypothetical protein